MGPTDKPAEPETVKEVPAPPPPADLETGKEVPAPPPPASHPTPPPPRQCNYSLTEVVLRFLVFVASLASVVVIVTSKQTIHIGPVHRVAKFTHSPAFIYFVAALSVAGLYALLTALASLSVIWKPICSPKFLLHFAFFDVLILGLVASATGTAGGVAYIGYKGNKHVQWMKVCSAFDKYCQHIVGALATSLFASVLLALLIWLSIFTLHKKLPK